MFSVGEAAMVNVDDNSAVILARDEKGFFARSAICTHACCLVTLCGDASCADLTPTPKSCQSSRVVSLEKDEALVCPCHGSLFRLSDGMPTTGPAKRALPAYKVTLEERDAWVDTGIEVDHASRG